MIEKGCTCKNTFSFPYPKGVVEAIRITYSQNGVVLLQKELPDCTFSENEVSVNLTQEDTLKFDSSKIIKIQIKVKLAGGAIVKSNIVETIADDALCCEVI